MWNLNLITDTELLILIYGFLRGFFSQLDLNFKHILLFIMNYSKQAYSIVHNNKSKMKHGDIIFLSGDYYILDIHDDLQKLSD